MKFRSNISLRKIESGLIMIYDKIEGTLFELNETASMIAEMIYNDHTLSIEQIVASILDVYDVERTVAYSEVKETINEFIEYGVLEGE